MEIIVGGQLRNALTETLNNINKEKMTKISRTKAVKLINNTKGKFFTVTYRKNNGDLRMINGNFKKDNFTPLGYMAIWSAKDKGYRKVNPKTITQLSINNLIYKVG